MYFSGWAIAAIFIPRLGDIYGRRKVYLWTMTGHLFVYLAIILSRNLLLTTVLQFFFGAVGVGRGTVGFLFTLELIPMGN
jgi:MFS family permease